MLHIGRGMNSGDLSRMALRVLIGAVGLSAVLGIFALLQRDLDEWSAKTLGTTLFVSAAALLIMANAAGLEKRSVGYLLISGTGLLAALGALLVFLAILWLVDDIDVDDGLWKFAASLEIIAVTSPAICSIPMAQTKRYGTRRCASRACNLDDRG